MARSVIGPPRGLAQMSAGAWGKGSSAGKPAPLIGGPTGVVYSGVAIDLGVTRRKHGRSAGRTEGGQQMNALRNDREIVA